MKERTFFSNVMSVAESALYIMGLKKRRADVAQWAESLDSVDDGSSELRDQALEAFLSNKRGRISETTPAERVDAANRFRAIMEKHSAPKTR